MTVLLLDNYDSFTWNLYQMLQSQTPEEVRVRRNNELSWQEIQEMAPSRIILSPGPGHPARATDFGICREVILHQQELACPVLGVCLGHQGIVHHLGGNVVPAPAIVHGKTSSVRILKRSPLFEGLPNPLTVMRYHSWMVDPDSLPDELEVIAETEPRSADERPLVMAIRHKTHPLFGVQFHPESVGTPEGARLLRNFLTLSLVPA